MRSGKRILSCFLSLILAVTALSTQIYADRSPDTEEVSVISETNAAVNDGADQVTAPEPLQAAPYTRSQTEKYRSVNNTDVPVVTQGKDATVIIFGRATCYNCKSTLKGLAEDAFASGSRFRFIFVEVNGASQSSVAALADEIGGNITYCYGESNYEMWYYVGQLDSMHSVTFPCVVVMDGSCDVQSIMTGPVSTKRIYDAISGFCGNMPSYGGSPYLVKIKSYPKTQYAVGEELDTSGGVITMFYTDSSYDYINITPDMISGFNTGTAHSGYMTVTYNGVDTTLYYTVSKPAVTGITVQPPSKTAYVTGEELDPTGGSLLVKYDNDTEKTIGITANMISGYDKAKAGKQTVTVTYEGFTDTFEVTVKEKTTKPKAAAAAGDEQVTLTWNDIGAAKYAVYIVNADGTLKALSTKLTGTAYTAKKLTGGTQYTFLVRAYVNGKWTAYSSSDYVKATPFSSVVKPTVEVIPADKQVTLTWDAIDGATKYAVYRLQDDGTLKALATKLTDTEYTVKKLVNHTEYQFLVRAYVNGKWTKYSANDYVYATPAALKPLVRTSAYDGMVTLRWGEVDNATKYAAYIVNNDGSLTCVSSKITNIKYTIKKLTNGTAYRFLVRAYVNGSWTKYTERDIVSATPKA